MFVRETKQIIVIMKSEALK